MKRYYPEIIRNAIILSISFLILLFFGINIISDIVTDEIDINPSAYIVKNGYPIFTNKKTYIKLIKDYPYDIGVSFKIYKVEKGESIWEIAQKNSITLDTLISANPFVENLSATEGEELVIPSKDGALVACDDKEDAAIMSELLNHTNQIKGDFKNSIFNLFCRDNMRLVFFEGKQPLIVNNYIEGLYLQKMSFNKPIDGYFTSYYGLRSDPFSKRPTFHDGLDIKNQTGAPILPIKKGIVCFSDWRDGYGYTIKILHEDGYISLYAHCSKLLVKTGDFVDSDTVIAFVGSTGKSTGSHLHLSVERHGKSLDPIYFVW